jgi:hypothetical protein
MSAVMTERIRIILEFEDEATRRALRLKAAAADKTPSQIVEALIAKHLADYVRQARKAIAENNDEE